MKIELVPDRVVLTDEQWERLPYVVLVNPARSRGAAYNGRRALVVPDVSAALLRFAITRHTQMGIWEAGLECGPKERPSWMPDGALEDWLMYWVRDEFSSPEHLNDLPMS